MGVQTGKPRKLQDFTGFLQAVMSFLWRRLLKQLFDSLPSARGERGRKALRIATYRHVCRRVDTFLDPSWLGGIGLTTGWLGFLEELLLNLSGQGF